MSGHWTTIETRVEGAVACVTLNRPDKLNSFVPEMGDELLAAFRAFGSDSKIKSVILTGAGRGFCAGADKDMQSDEELRRRLGASPFLTEFAPLIHGYGKPAIAAVNGVAVGIGVTAILGFDFILASRNARLILPFAALNIPPGMGASYHLPRRVGARRAAELLMLGEPVEAEAALDMGLVNAVAEPQQLMAEAMALAQRLAATNPAVLAELRRAMLFGASHDFAAAVAREQAMAKLSLAGGYPPLEPDHAG